MNLEESMNKKKDGCAVAVVWNLDSWNDNNVQVQSRSRLK